ncbi:MAG: multicopper oxidase domain-containing protein [Candidatus Aenigmarchaeota archaeon]|nr:multicopper oxidase domain-containing protein [Candidatus Aenigmarchaeota archaeon]
MDSKKTIAMLIAVSFVVFSASFLATGQAKTETHEVYTGIFNPHVARPEPAANGIREVTVVAEDAKHEVYPGVFMDAWTLNGTVPGPTLTAIEGETIRIKFINNGKRPQTLHFHGIHELRYDGVHEVIAPGKSYIYELKTEPPGMYIYHSHVFSITEKDSRGYFGSLIVYTKAKLPPAKELVLFQQFIDTDGDFDEAEFYAFNGRADYYMNHPIEIKANETVRIYLANINIAEPSVLHVHANVFREYGPIGFDRNYVLNDASLVGWGQRKIIEFSYATPGLYMFHDHIGEHLERGMRGWFKVA